MNKFIAEFVLDSDMTLPEEASSIEWSDPAGEFEIVFYNEKSGFTYVQEALKAHLSFQADDLDTAKERSQDLLASILNSLVFVSMSMIRQAKLVRVVDWEPGKVMRDALYFAETPRFAVPEPMFFPEIMQAAGKLYPAQTADRAQSALRWFRLGIGGDGIDEQFTFFWFALETAAEALKQPGKVRNKCPVCEGDLYCESCGNHPEHRRFAADAIRDVILESFEDKEHAKTAFKVLTKIRHTIMHGRRMESIESSLPYDTQAATNELVQITRNAIWRMLDFSSYINRKLDLHLVDTNDVIRGRLITGARIQTVFGSDPNNPNLGNRDGMQVKIRHPGQPE